MDRLTGLGQTMRDYIASNDVITVGNAYDSLLRAYGNSYSAKVEFGDLSIDEGDLCINGEPVCKMDDLAYGKVCSALSIPTAYIMKLPEYMRDTNILYWFRVNADSSVTVTYRDGELVDFRAGVEVAILDVFKTLTAVIPDAIVINPIQQTNSTQFDFVMYDDEPVTIGGVDYAPGVRYVHKEGLKAPEISPILFSLDSCAVVEFAYENINIKNMAMSDILESIKLRVHECYAATEQLGDSFEHVCGLTIKNPRRRAYLYCKEHNVPDRIRLRVLAAFDDLSWKGDFTVSDFVSLFSCAPYLETVKPASARKLQVLAGYVVSKVMQEHRCEKCDSRTDED